MNVYLEGPCTVVIRESYFNRRWIAKQHKGCAGTCFGNPEAFGDGIYEGFFSEVVCPRNTSRWIHEKSDVYWSVTIGNFWQKWNWKWYKILIHNSSKLPKDFGQGIIHLRFAIGKLVVASGGCVIANCATVQPSQDRWEWRKREVSK